MLINLGVGNCACRRKYNKEAKRVNRVLGKKRAQPNSLLHEIDSNLILARGFLLCRGLLAFYTLSND